MKSEIPKALHPMYGRTLLGHVIFAARGLTLDHIAVVVHHGRDHIAAYAAECDPGITIADRDETKGTGRALQYGLRAPPTDLSGPVAVAAGNTSLLSADVLLRLLGRHEGNAVTVLTAVVPDPTGYSKIACDTEETVANVVERKDAAQEQREIAEINTSTYVFDADFLHGAIGGLDAESVQDEMYLTGVVAKAYGSGADVGSYIIEDSWLVEGCNNLIQLANLWGQMNRRTLEAWMRFGATVVDPATTSIDVTVVLASDCRILSGTGLYGTTSITKGALVGPGEFTDALMDEGVDARHIVVRNATVEAGTTLPSYIVLTRSARATGVSKWRGKL